MLNANYLLARLRREGVLEYLPAAYDRLCMHEFVLSGRADEARAAGSGRSIWPSACSTTASIRPTVYFPLIVDEALLVEPTETETKETLDRFAEVVAEILREAREDPGDRPQRPVHARRSAASTRRARRGTRSSGRRCRRP